MGKKDGGRYDGGTFIITAYSKRLCTQKLVRFYFLPYLFKLLTIYWLIRKDKRNASNNNRTGINQFLVQLFLLLPSLPPYFFWYPVVSFSSPWLPPLTRKMGGHGTSLLSYYFLEKNWKIFLNNIFHISRGGGMLSAGEGGSQLGED
jgi:hypothetical protein